MKAEAKARSGMRTDLRGNSPQVGVGRAADKLGAFVGKDRKTIEKMEAV